MSDLCRDNAATAMHVAVVVKAQLYKLEFKWRNRPLFAVPRLGADKLAI